MDIKRNEKIQNELELIKKDMEESLLFIFDSETYKKFSSIIKTVEVK